MFCLVATSSPQVLVVFSNHPVCVSSKTIGEFDIFFIFPSLTANIGVRFINHESQEKIIESQEMIGNFDEYKCREI